jgi:hypothetical protein
MRHKPDSKRACSIISFRKKPVRYPQHGNARNQKSHHERIRSSKLQQIIRSHKTTDAPRNTVQRLLRRDQLQIRKSRKLESWQFGHSGDILALVSTDMWRCGQLCNIVLPADISVTYQIRHVVMYMLHTCYTAIFLKEKTRCMNDY